MNVETMYAHTPGHDGSWHSLVKHLTSVAQRARTLAEPFGGGDPAYWTGLWHDLGKSNPDFQAYLRAQHEGTTYATVPHAIWGATLVYSLFKSSDEWKILALTIAGHHGGLDKGGTLAQKLEEFLAARPDAMTLLRLVLLQLPPPPNLILPRVGELARELFIRMVFSAVVDADYLDTEKHFHPEQTYARERARELGGLSTRLETSQRELMSKAAESTVNQVRRQVYEACLEAARGPQGVYRLTVPTGGGKTRSGVAFALRHAEIHKLRRVVVAIPYTSIIDQTAKDYRDVFGDDAVLEHHSQVAILEDESQAPNVYALRLASENWDAPIVVTTTVQLFESLFSRTPSKVRKLHNLAQSVIVLDEVQTLPEGLLEPTLDVLRTLVEDYGVTLVLSTATQPAFDDTPYLKAFRGLEVHEIVPAYQEHFRILKRVQYETPKDPLSWHDLARRLDTEHQVLVVLNTRKDAVDLIYSMGRPGDVIHLSALLCGAHRRTVLEEVRRRLDQELPVRLISTQVVEAGVDIDFPTVYRAIGPLDRIVQAAGRCNRNGRLQEGGRVVVFEPAQGRSPTGPYKAGLLEARALLARYGPESLHDPALYHQYFQRLFAHVDLDEKGIQSARRALDYPRVAEAYRLIADNTVPVVVDYKEGLERLQSWLDHPSRDTWRPMQPYLVNVYAREAQQFAREGWLEQVSDGLYKAVAYNEKLGLMTAFNDPSDLVQ